MKQQAIQYVALDVHQATVVVSVRDERGAVVMRATVATEAKAIIGLIRGLGSRVYVVLEKGTQAQWLHDVLEPHAERVIVCNVRGRGETGNKSDRVDADRLSELLRCGSLKSVTTVQEELREPGRGRHAGDAADQGVVPRSWDQNTGNVGVPAIDAQAVVVAARAARCTYASRGAVR